MRKPLAPFRFERQEMMRLEDMQKAKSDWACQKEMTNSTRQKDTQLACRTIILVGFHALLSLLGVAKTSVHKEQISALHDHQITSYPGVEANYQSSPIHGLRLRANE